MHSKSLSIIVYQIHIFLVVVVVVVYLAHSYYADGIISHTFINSNAECSTSTAFRYWYSILSICSLIITFVSHLCSLHSIAVTALRLMVFRFCWHPTTPNMYDIFCTECVERAMLRCKWKQQITAEKWSADIFVSCNKWHWLNWVACCFYYQFLFHIKILCRSATELYHVMFSCS